MTVDQDNRLEGMMEVELAIVLQRGARPGLVLSCI